MKNFLLADSCELIAVRIHFHLVSPKTFDSYFLEIMYVEFMKKFSSPRRFERADGCWNHFGPPEPKTLDSYFLDMMNVEFMKNFLLARRFERADGC